MNIQEDRFASYKLFAAALAKKGYTLKFNPEYPAEAIYASPSGKAWQTRAAHMQYPFNTQEVHDISVQKDRAYALAEAAGFPVPASLYVTGETSDDGLADMLAKFGKVIVKPLDLSRSRGLSLDIDSLEKLKQAITYAQSFSPSVVVQEQVAGEEIRFTVLDGKVVAALLRQTARVIGDGHTTLAALIKRENEARKNLHFDMIVYPQLDESNVPAEFLTSERIPAEGEIVEVNRSTMVKGGCSIYNVLPKVHESYLNKVEDLVAHLGGGFVVVDVFCKDYTEPAAEDNYRFIEFNTAPALRLYYACRDGKQFDIVGRLSDRIDEWLQGSDD